MPVLPTCSAEEAIEQINHLAGAKRGFLFVLDYALEKNVIIPLEKVHQLGIRYHFEGMGDVAPSGNTPKVNLLKYPLSYEAYKDKLDTVKAYIRRGNSFLVNLTQPTPIEVDMSLVDIFTSSKAKYKLLFQDKFVCFSPETFIKIQNGVLSTFPMKGTIDATNTNARELILNNSKEKAEHTTIVDLLRNDLSMICKKVWVERFRYIEKINTHQGDILQVSSEIRGQLFDGFESKLGTLLFKLLPAGSISGAPKPETLRIINEVEGYERGYYTGVCGVFDGKNLTSGVMIRFIEQTAEGLVFKSGGGITAQSNVDDEYHELIQKIYLPF